MQFLKELSNGQRVRVTREQYDEDRLGPLRDRLVYLVRQNHATIYHMNGMSYKQPHIPKYRYGGRRRGANTGSLHYNGA